MDLEQLISRIQEMGCDYAQTAADTTLTRKERQEGRTGGQVVEQVLELLGEFQDAQLLQAHPHQTSTPFRYRLNSHFPGAGSSVLGETCSTIFRDRESAEASFNRQAELPAQPTLELWEERLLKSN